MAVSGASSGRRIEMMSVSACGTLRNWRKRGLQTRPFGKPGLPVPIAALIREMNYGTPFLSELPARLSTKEGQSRRASA